MSALPCTGGRTLECALGFVRLSHMGSGVCGPVSHGFWRLWDCLTWALGFVGLSHMCTGGRTVQHALGFVGFVGFVGLSHMGSEVCGPVSHGLWRLWASLTWALGFVGLSHMGSGVCGLVSDGQSTV